MQHITKIAQRKWATLLSVMVVGVGLDQWTKRLADAHLKDRDMVVIMPEFFELRYSRNRGAFFSLGASMPDSFRRGFFIVATIIAVGLMIQLFRKTTEAQRVLRWALILLLTGAVGNLIDRAVYGEVVDFLHLHWREVFHWATFNVADICITAGLILLIVDMFLSGRNQQRQSAP